MPTPSNPVLAVTHADPYPYYAGLVERSPLYFDEPLKCWVAASASAVTAALESGACRVRPADEPVPNALVGSVAGNVFRHLVRMNDDAGHCPLKLSVTTAVSAIDARLLHEVSRDTARSLADERRIAEEPERITEFSLRMPVFVIGAILGVPAHHLDRTARLIGEYAGSISPAATAADIETGNAAATELIEVVRAQVRTGGGVLALMDRELRSRGIDDEFAVAANGVGLLVQSYEATAGLLCNTLVALAREGDRLERVRRDEEYLLSVIDEVSRFDAPVQNTRRYVARDVSMGGVDMTTGDTVLVVLAAANRDLHVNPNPDSFDPSRMNRRTFTFGLGRHECPGTCVASIISAAGVGLVLERVRSIEQFRAPVGYRRSTNTRIPVFSTALAAGRETG